MFEEEEIMFEEEKMMFEEERIIVGEEKIQGEEESQQPTTHTTLSVRSFVVNSRPLDEGGRHFWGSMHSAVEKHIPGEVPATYRVPWEHVERWRQMSAVEIYDVLQFFIWQMDRPTISKTSMTRTPDLTRDQKGRFVHSCWLVQLFKRHPLLEEMGNADWEALPEWQHEVFADIFESIDTFQEVAEVPHYCHQQWFPKWR